MRKSMDQNYVKLFGDLDSRSVDQDRSVYSPAAYLADLLQLIDDHLKSWADLKGTRSDGVLEDTRRGDIYELPLNGENTRTLVYYIEIVNDLLARRLEDITGEPAAKAVANSRYPENLPRDVEHDRAALYLEKLNQTPLALYRAFARDADNDTSAHAYLGLSAEDVSFWQENPADATVKPEHTAAAVKAEYGGKLDAQIDGAKLWATDFRRVLDLSFEDLQALVESSFSDTPDLEAAQKQLVPNTEIKGYVTLAFDKAEGDYALAFVADGAKSPTDAIPHAWYSAVRRLVRMARRLDYGIADFELLIRVSGFPQFHPSILQFLAVTQEFQTRHNLTVTQVAVLFGAPKNVEKCQELKCFSFLPLLNKITDVFDDLPLSGRDILTKDHVEFSPWLRKMAKIGTKDIVSLRSFLKAGNDTKMAPASWILALWRLGTLSACFDMTVSELCRVIKVLEGAETDWTALCRNVLINKSGSHPENLLSVMGRGDLGPLVCMLQALDFVVGWTKPAGVTVELLEQTLNSSDMLLPTEDETKRLQTCQAIYAAVAPTFLNAQSFVVDGVSPHVSRLVHQSLKTHWFVEPMEHGLLTLATPELSPVLDDVMQRLDELAPTDLICPGVCDKIAQKVMRNLVMAGYVSLTGHVANEVAQLAVEDFSLQVDADPLRPVVFDLIAQRIAQSANAHFLVTDLDTLGLPAGTQLELYDNLIFNRHLSSDGRILDPIFFNDTALIEDFEINTDFTQFDPSIFKILQSLLKAQFEIHVPVGAATFAGLGLSAQDTERLLKNLQFNDYLDETNRLKAPQNIAEMDVDDLLIEQRFYPLAAQILAGLKGAMQAEIAQKSNLSPDRLKDVAEKIALAWARARLEEVGFLQGDHLTDLGHGFFGSELNANRLDLHWPFEAAHNQQIFAQIQAARTFGAGFHVSLERVKAKGASQEAISALRGFLEAQGIVAPGGNLSASARPAFLDLDRGSQFHIPGFELFQLDVFIELYQLAQKLTTLRGAIDTRYRALAEEQKASLYGPLSSALNLPEASLRFASEKIFGGPTAAIREWLRPVVTGHIVDGTLQAPNADANFSFVYKRLWQFGQFSKKSKLSTSQIEVAFLDQVKWEEFADALDSQGAVTKLPLATADAVLQPVTGPTYLITNKAGGAGYRAFSPLEDGEQEIGAGLVADLLGVSGHLGAIDHVSAAYVDDQGRNVIIADGTQYVQNPGKSKAWEIVGPETSALQIVKAAGFDTVKAAFQAKDGTAYLFGTTMLARYADESRQIEQGFPTATVPWAGTSQNTIGLSARLDATLTAAFQGTDDQNYFFYDDGSFMVGSDSANARFTRQHWGATKDNLAEMGMVDAFLKEGQHLFAFAGDQVLRLRDNPTLPGSNAEPGSPSPLDGHFDFALPKEFHSGIQAACVSLTDVLHLFRDDAVLAAIPGPVNGDWQITTTKPSDFFRPPANPLAKTGAVEAALIGLDGRLYLFSGKQTYRYSGSSYDVVDEGYPRATTTEWSGMERIDAGFVLDGQTYVFGEHADTPHVLSYETSADTDPTNGARAPQTEESAFWQALPAVLRPDQEGRLRVDAAFDTPDGALYVLFGDSYVYHERAKNWWSEPLKIAEKWPALAQADIGAAFFGKDQKLHVFYGTKYMRFGGANLDVPELGYPRSTKDMWGKVDNTLLETGHVDAALTIKTLTGAGSATYLFSGAQYVRFSGALTQTIDVGYPRAISALRQEPGLARVDTSILRGPITAAHCDGRQVILQSGGVLYVFPLALSARYRQSDAGPFQEVEHAILLDGQISLARQGTWTHLNTIGENDLHETSGVPNRVAKLPTAQVQRGNAILAALDENIYVFEGDSYFDASQGSTFAIADKWFRAPNAIQDRGRVDAVLRGLDGLTYLFSGSQVVAYSGNSFMGASVLADRGVMNVPDMWDGLHSVRCAFVYEGRTFLASPPDAAGRFEIVEYGSGDYSHPPVDGPRHVSASWWGFPPSLLDAGWASFSALIQVSDEVVAFVLADAHVTHNFKTGIWTSPADMSVLWPDAKSNGHVLSDLSAVLKAGDGRDYYFGDGSYVCQSKRGSYITGRIDRDWGIHSLNLSTRVDAAFTVLNKFTFLISGDHYVRYSDRGCTRIDPGYPKSVKGALVNEPCFAGLQAKEEFTTLLQMHGAPRALFSTQTSLFVLAGEVLWVGALGREPHLIEPTELGQRHNPVRQDGRVDAAAVHQDKTYLFAGRTYLRYSGTDYAQVDPGYPKEIDPYLATDLGLDVSGATFAADGLDAIICGLGKSGNTIHLFKDDTVWNSATNIVEKVAHSWLSPPGSAPTQSGAHDSSPPAATVELDRSLLTGAFVDTSGQFYTFQSQNLLRFATSGAQTPEAGYPDAVTSHFSIPAHFDKRVDGAFTYNGFVYLKSNGALVRYRGKAFNAPLDVQKPVPTSSSEKPGYRLEDLRVIAKFKALADRLGGSPTLSDIFDPNRPSSTDPFEPLAVLFGTTVEDIIWLKRNNAFLPQALAEQDRLTLEQILKFDEVFTVARKLGRSARQVHTRYWTPKYADPSSPVPSEDFANALYRALGDKHSQDRSWPELEDELRRKTNVMKRDAMLGLLVHLHANVADVDELFETYLLDFQMGEEAKTSRIKEAISAVQMFIDRYLLDLEGASKDTQTSPLRTKLRERWRWMHSYRVWEANRKVFLYPENYIRPELRATKTPQFEQFEQAIMQGTLDEKLITTSLNQYIDEFAEISRLTIAGGYVYGAETGAQSKDKQMILLGRTKSEPFSYYYRTATFIDGQTENVIWQPWLPVNIQIDTDRVYPVFAMNKIFMFWSKVEVRSDGRTRSESSVFKSTDEGFEAEGNASTRTVLQFYFSYLGLNGDWVPPQRVNYEISRNANISAYELFIVGEPAKTNDDFDSLRIECQYVTESFATPRYNDKDWADSLGKLPWRRVYMKVNALERDYYMSVEGGTRKPCVLAQLPNQPRWASGFYVWEESDDEEILHEALPFQDYVELLGNGVSDFANAVKGKDVKEHTTAAKISLQVDDGSNRFLSITENEIGLSFSDDRNDRTTFTLSKGAVGEGTVLVPTDSPNMAVTFVKDPVSDVHKLELVPLEKLQSNQQLRDASFQFVTNRETRSEVFNLYPESGLVKANSSVKATDREAGYETFRELFPTEHWMDIQSPVRLSFGDAEDEDFAWYAYDYKGGSFLCKPAGGSAGAKLAPVNDASISTRIRAAVHNDGKTILFDDYGDCRWTTGRVPGANQEFRARIANTWGQVPTRIHTDNAVDAVLLEKTGDGYRPVLFRGDEYVTYAPAQYDWVEGSGATKFSSAQSSRRLPVAGIKAAFKLGEVEVYIRPDGKLLTSEDNFNKPHNVADHIVLPVNATLPAAALLHDVEILDTTFQYTLDGSTWQSIKIDRTLLVSLSAQFPPLEQTDAAHFLDMVRARKGVRYSFALNGVVYVQFNKHAPLRIEAGELTRALEMNPNPKVFAGASTVIGNDLFVLVGSAPGYRGPELRLIWLNPDIPNAIRGISLEGTASAPRNGLVKGAQNTVLVVVHDRIWRISPPSNAKKTTQPAPYSWDGRVDPYDLGELQSRADSLPWFDFSTPSEIAGFQPTPAGAGAQIDFAISYPDRVIVGDARNAWELKGNPHQPKTILNNALTVDGPFNLATRYPNVNQADIRTGFADGTGQTYLFMQNTVLSIGESAAGAQTFASDKPIAGNWGQVGTHLRKTGQVDAAFEWRGTVFLISKDELYKYQSADPENPVIAPGYPQNLGTNTDGVPTHINQSLAAAFVVQDRGYLFYEGWSNYAEFGTGARHGNLRPFSDWNLPFRDGRFDAAYSTAGNVYFIRGDKIWSMPNDLASLPHVDQLAYEILRVSSIMGGRFSQALFSGGVPAFLNTKTQEYDELPRFQLNESQTHHSSKVNSAVINVHPARLSKENFPVNSHLEFNGPNGQYYWELFYHLPLLVGQRFSESQEFEKAKTWLEFIFDPAEGAQYWKFLPFLAVDIEALTKGLSFTDTRAVRNRQSGLNQSTQDLCNEIERALPALRDDLMPFAARMRGISDTLTDHQERDFNALNSWDGGQPKSLLWTKMVWFDKKLSEAAKAIDAHIAQRAQQGARRAPPVALKRLQDDVRRMSELRAIACRLPDRYNLMKERRAEQIHTFLDDPFDPHAIAALRQVAYRRVVVTNYINNIIDWADSLFRKYTVETVSHARGLYVLAHEILGRAPMDTGAAPRSDDRSFNDLENSGSEIDHTDRLDKYDFLFDVDPQVKRRGQSFSHSGEVHQSVTNPYFAIPENDVVLKYWDRIEDRLTKIRAGQNILGVKQPLPLFQPPLDPMAAVAAAAQGSGGLSSFGSTASVPHYRFTFMLKLARGLVATLKELNGELLASVEKKDAETLSVLENKQQAQILEMSVDIKKSQIREAEISLKSLEESKKNAEFQLSHYEGLIDEGMLISEQAQLAMMGIATLMNIPVGYLQLAAGVAHLIPELKVGAPFTIGASFGGEEIGTALSTGAEVLQTAGQALQSGAETAGVLSQYLRMTDEWDLQLGMAEGQIKEIEAQIDGAKQQIQSAKLELKVAEQEVENSGSIATFMRGKYSNAQLYSWMISRLSGIYFETYKLAHDLAKSAEMAFCFERGVPISEVNFIKGSYWDGHHKGMLAGLALGLDLDRMERAYADTHERGLEITKTISLMALDPTYLMVLQNKGSCVFQFTEQMFDYDFPGHFRRQIESISVALRASDGTKLMGTLTQLNHSMVLAPDPKAVAYLLDPQTDMPSTIRSDWRASQQIAVSEFGLNAPGSRGVFDSAAVDGRYLPFEGTGAVSTWRLDVTGLSAARLIKDVQVELNYRAAQGGAGFADAVKGMLKPVTTSVTLEVAKLAPADLYALSTGAKTELALPVSQQLLPGMTDGQIVALYFDFGDSVLGHGTLHAGDQALSFSHNSLLMPDDLTMESGDQTWRITWNDPTAPVPGIRITLAFRTALS